MIEISIFLFCDKTVSEVGSRKQELERHGNTDIMFIMMRQSKESPPAQGKMEKIISQFKAVKKFTFDILRGNEINRAMRVIKQEAIEETAVCNLTQEI